MRFTVSNTFSFILGVFCGKRGRCLSFPAAPIHHALAETVTVNTLSSWIVGILMVVMGLVGLLFTARTVESESAIMGIIMFVFAVFFVFRLIVAGGRDDS